jgi:MerR family transcriptional regulator, light-induced transcriptional regulator
MQQFTIADIESLTGIKAHTLRIWEQRYPFFRPKRKESKHRYYDNEDLKELLRIAFLYHSGWKISRIASLSREEIAGQVAGTEVASGNYKPYINRLITSALDFDERSFVALLDEIIGQIGFETSIIEVCYPYLQKIGLLWSTNNVIPAQEHFSTYIIQNKVISETERLPPPENATARIVLFCPQGEFHELPLLFIHHQLRKNGWSTVYLGSNVGLPELEQVASATDVACFYLHLITNFTGLDIDTYLEGLVRKFPQKQIIGSGVSIRRSQRSFVNVKLLRTDREIYDFIYRKQVEA